MIAGKARIREQELQGGARLVGARREHNDRVRRLERGEASPAEFVDALFDDLPYLLPSLKGGGRAKRPSKASLRASRKQSKNLLHLATDMIAKNYVFLRRLGETVDATQQMDATAKAMAREHYDLRGGSAEDCKGKRKGKPPKCEDDPACQWVPRKGCRARLPPKRPPLRKKDAEDAAKAIDDFRKNEYVKAFQTMSQDQKDMVERMMKSKEDQLFEESLRGKGRMTRVLARMRRWLSSVKDWLHAEYKASVFALTTVSLLGYTVYYCFGADALSRPYPFTWAKLLEEANPLNVNVTGWLSGMATLPSKAWSWIQFLKGGKALRGGIDPLSMAATVPFVVVPQLLKFAGMSGALWALSRLDPRPAKACVKPCTTSKYTALSTCETRPYSVNGKEFSWAYCTDGKSYDNTVDPVSVLGESAPPNGPMPPSFWEHATVEDGVPAAVWTILRGSVQLYPLLPPQRVQLVRRLRRIVD